MPASTIRTYIVFCAWLSSIRSNLTWIRGQHSVKSGAYFEQSRNSEGKGGVGAGPWAGQFTFSTDVNNPAARGTTYEELVAAYSEQIRGLLDGGADVLLVETIFDTLNARAAFFAIAKVYEERGLAPLDGLGP